MNCHEVESYLLSHGSKQTELQDKAHLVKMQTLGRSIWGRALIEISNHCTKNCYYCGIRNNNPIKRYQLTISEVQDLALKAYQDGIRSLVLQSGEIQSPSFTEYVGSILEGITRLTNQDMHITLSCGEQSLKTLSTWQKKGAHRYLLRIETSNRELYYKIHPENHRHSFEKRLKTLEYLKLLNYQVGSGILIGFPFQTVSDLAKDILFLKSLDLDMIGSGPYIEHPQTPIYQHSCLHFSLQERLNLTLNAISLLRILCSDINIASTTALECIIPDGRQMALAYGANILMNCYTPHLSKLQYDLYPGKNQINTPTIENESLKVYLKNTRQELRLDEYGDSLHYLKKYKSSPDIINKSKEETLC